MEEIVAVEQDLFVVNIDYRGLDAVADEILGSRFPLPSYEYQFLPWVSRQVQQVCRIKFNSSGIFYLLSFFFYYFFFFDPINVTIETGLFERL